MQRPAGTGEWPVPEFRRHAVYYTPPPGAFAAFGAGWLGWDVEKGRRAARAFEMDGAEEITATPRRYGFHATLKPPFRLADGRSVDELHAAVARVAAATPAICGARLRLQRLGPFLALVPATDHAPFSALGDAMVRALDAFRLPPSEAELKRRRGAGLTPAQDAHLLRWGYPYVFEEFRFHMTLSGKLDDATAAAVEAALSPVLAEVVPDPFEITEVTLAGEDEDGYFHEVHRYTLSG
jgi:putative phosphonate metabolism protein